MSPIEGNAVLRDDDDDDVRSMDLADLLAAIALHEDDPRLANAALDELHGRWGVRIDEMCRRMTMGGFGKLVGWHPLATEVWRWLWRNAEDFTSQDLTGQALDGRFYRWVECAVQHRLIDMARREDRMALAELPCDASIRVEEEADVDEGDVGFSKPKLTIAGVFTPPAPGTPEADAEAALFAHHPIETREAIECLRCLSPKDQAVLQGSSAYFKPGERQVDIPKPELKQMIDAFNTTVDGLRALRSRAFKKIDACMKAKARKRTGGA